MMRSYGWTLPSDHFPAARSPERALALGWAIARMHLGARRLRALSERAQPRARAELLGAVCEEVLTRHGFSKIVSGRVPPGPALLVSNHLSYFDPIAVLGTTPAIPIAKIEASRWPGLGSAMRIGGALFVDRRDKRSGARVLRSAREALSAGASVLAFPEGTTSAGTEVLPFQPGLFGLARRAGVPIVPVAIRYSSPTIAWVGDDEFLPHYLRVSARAETGAHVRYGDPLSVGEDEPVEAVAKRARGAVCALLGLE